MHVTVYQKSPQGWQQVTEYYQFPKAAEAHRDQDLPLRLRPRHRCPGCLKEMTSLVMTQHRCLGGTTEWPRLTTQGRPRKAVAATRQTR